MARNIGDGATKEYSHKKVLYTKSGRRISSCFAKKKMLSKIQIFLALNIKKIVTACL